MTAPATAARCIHDLLPVSCAHCNPPAVQPEPAVLEAYHVMAAYHRTWCRNCEQPVEQGDRVGFVRDVGVCCAECIGADR